MSSCNPTAYHLNASFIREQTDIYAIVKITDGILKRRTEGYYNYCHYDTISLAATKYFERAGFNVVIRNGATFFHWN